MTQDMVPKKIQKEIEKAILKAYSKIGLIGLIILVIIFGVSYYCTFKILEDNFEKRMESYKTELDQSKVKNIELWKIQTDLTFEFIEFLESNVFNNPDIESNIIEQKRVSQELNTYYGKLFLILDKEIIENINLYLDETTSEVQRYYLYCEIRLQLMNTLYGTEINQNNCPYISKNISKTSVRQIQIKPKTIKEMKEYYPFIEEGDEKDTYKSLPFFSISD